MKAAIYTLGCKVNQYDSQEISETLRGLGYEIVSPREESDIYIVNSCTVTAESDRKTRQEVRKIKKAHPGAVVLVTGCMPQAFPSYADNIPEADIVIGNHQNYEIPLLLSAFSAKGERIVKIIPHQKGESYRGCGISGFDEHTRAFVKIQDGCDRFCSYCAIPYARGRSRSKPLEQLRAELLTLSQNGYREIVLTGINLSFYGRDFGLSLVDAVRLCENIDGISRVRLGSLEPDHITAEVIDGLSKCKKLCPQFHISLQSGSDRVLKKMNRHYTSSDFAELVGSLRTGFADAAITTDIICGFPGETEEDFQNTLEFVKQMKFEKVHIFPYSRRPGTPADRLPEQVKNADKEDRCRRLSAVCEEIRRDFMLSLVGKRFDVLFETPSADAQNGYTKNYIPVTVKTSQNLCGKIFTVTITALENDVCIGKI